MFWLLFCLSFGKGVVEFRDANVYQPLMREEVRVDMTGHVFVLAFPLGQITIYSPDGEVVNRIGGHGQGPGKLTYPIDFWVDESKIYVFDMHNTTVSSFTKDGAYIDRVKAPHRNVILNKVTGGWIYGNWGTFGAQGRSKNIAWADDSFSQTQVVFELPDMGISKAVRTFSTDTEHKGLYSPLENRAQIEVSADGRTIYISDTLDFKIHVIDAVEKTVVRTITRSEPKIPFNSDWADERFAAETTPQMRDKFTFTKYYPDYFPPFRAMILTHDDHLVVNRWYGNPDGRDRLLTLNTAGEEVKRDWDMAFLKRIVGKYDGFLYMTTWNDSEEEAGVVRLPLTEAMDFAKTSPISYDGPMGRSISY